MLEIDEPLLVIDELFSVVDEVPVGTAVPLDSVSELLPLTREVLLIETEEPDDVTELLPAIDEALVVEAMTSDDAGELVPVTSVEVLEETRDFVPVAAPVVEDALDGTTTTGDDVPSTTVHVVEEAAGLSEPLTKVDVGETVGAAIVLERTVSSTVVTMTIDEPVAVAFGDCDDRVSDETAVLPRTDVALEPVKVGELVVNSDPLKDSVVPGTVVRVLSDEPVPMTIVFADVPLADGAPVSVSLVGTDVPLADEDVVLSRSDVAVAVQGPVSVSLVCTDVPTCR